MDQYKVKNRLPISIGIGQASYMHRTHIRIPYPRHSLSTRVQIYPTQWITMAKRVITLYGMCPVFIVLADRRSCGPFRGTPARRNNLYTRAHVFTISFCGRSASERRIVISVTRNYIHTTYGRRRRRSANASAHIYRKALSAIVRASRAQIQLRWLQSGSVEGETNYLFANFK